MKRRNFVLLSVYAGAAVSIPFTGCSSESAVAGKAWVQPGFLSHICDAKTLRDIGTAYREKVKDESREKELINLLLTDGNTVSSPDTVITTSLTKKIEEDFLAGKTVIVKGWVLSQTEARQCALFSLTQK